MLIHLLVVVVAVVLANLGVWQLNRLEQRQAQNNIFNSRQTQLLEEADIQKISTLKENENNTYKDFEFRKIELTGTYYELERESVVRQRTLMGRPGVWLLTPFRAQGLNTFIINRGWVPRELSPKACRGRDEVLPQSEQSKPATTQIKITGILRLPEAVNSSAEWTKCLSKVELSGYQDLTNFPFWIQITEYEGVGPLFLESPDRGNGPHLSYAIQWFIFTSLVLIIYPLVLIKNNRKKSTT